MGAWVYTIQQRRCKHRNEYEYNTHSYILYSFLYCTHTEPEALSAPIATVPDEILQNFMNITNADSSEATDYLEQADCVLEDGIAAFYYDRDNAFSRHTHTDTPTHIHTHSHTHTHAHTHLHNTHNIHTHTHTHTHTHRCKQCSKS